MTVFDRIEMLRNSRHISQGNLEKELGFSNGSISKWKTSMPTPERLQKLAEYFGTSTEYLLGVVPFKDDDEALTSISIAAVKYVMHNRSEFGPSFTDGTMDYYFELLYEANNKLYGYVNRLVTMYNNEDSKITNVECFELANILFGEIKYNKKNYDGLIHLTDIFGETSVVKLNLNEIPKFTRASINFSESLLYKIMDSNEGDYNSYTSFSASIKNKNKIEISDPNHSYSFEALEVAESYESATIDKQNIVRLTLGLPLKETNKPYLLPNAAHDIEGASDEDKAHDDAMMDDDNLWR